MKKPILLLLCLSFSPTTYAYDCGSNFIKSHHSSHYQKNAQVFQDTLNDLATKMKATDDLVLKLDFLEEQYDLIAKEFRDKKELIASNIEELIQLKKIPEESRSSAIKSFEGEITNDLSTYTDEIIFEAQKVFEKSGIEVFVKQREFSVVIDGNTQTKVFHYLELGSASKNSEAVKKIARYKDRFQTKTVTFDLMENIQIGSGGFSIAQIGRIDLGVRGLRNLLVDDLITMVGKHEFHHAAFGAKRLKGEESIYHVQYIATKGQPLSSVKNGYNMYMSAEEVYNWANNSFWASTRMGDISSYARKDFVGDINGIIAYLPGTKRIADQTVEITEHFLNKVDNIKNRLEAGAFDFQPVFYTKQKTVARSADEAFYFSVEDEELGHIALDFISPEYRKTVQDIFKNRVDVELRMSKKIDFSNISEADQAIAMQSFLKEEGLLNKSHYDDLLTRFSASQKELQEVSRALSHKSELAIEVSDDFVKYLKIELEKNPDFLTTRSAQKMFLEMRQMYRELGGVVKPGYKGYKN